jgi:pimeloyl-ACP methyl ester carboxylesterase
MKRTKLSKMIIVITGAVSAFLTYGMFRRQKRETITDLRENSQIIETACGPIEYAMNGGGPSVLICHGGGGGYDQGLLFALPESGFQFVVPSRPGYLGTPLDTGQTFEAQADAYVALLDELGIHQVAVFGTSGGGPSALQFALRYPGRCWGIILLSAISLPIPAFPVFMQQFTEKIMPYSDFIPWLLLNTPLLDVLIDRNTRSQIGKDANKKSMLKRVMKSVFPISLRMKGALNDVRQIALMPIYPLEKITAPALVIHGERDTIVPFTQGQWSASKMPNTQFIPIKNGEHFSFITHIEILKPAMIEFLRSHALSSPLKPTRDCPE